MDGTEWTEEGSLVSEEEAERAATQRRRVQLRDGGAGTVARRGGVEKPGEG